MSNVKLVKQLSNSYPSLQRIGDLLHNENELLKQVENSGKYNFKKYSSTNGLREISRENDERMRSLHANEKHLQFWDEDTLRDNNNKIIYEEKECKENSMTRVNLNQDWKKLVSGAIYPKSSEIRLDIDFFLRKQLTLLLHF